MANEALFGNRPLPLLDRSVNVQPVSTGSYSAKQEVTLHCGRYRKNNIVGVGGTLLFGIREFLLFLLPLLLWHPEVLHTRVEAPEGRKNSHFHLSLLILLPRFRNGFPERILDLELHYCCDTS